MGLFHQVRLSKKFKHSSYKAYLQRPLHSVQTHLLTLLWIEKVGNCSLEVILGEFLCHPINLSIPQKTTDPSHWYLLLHLQTSELPMLHSTKLWQALSPTHTSPVLQGEPQTLLMSQMFACADSWTQCILLIFERHATVQLKSKAMLEYLLQLFFFWLYIFLVPFGCSVATIDGTAMPSSCVLHTAHLVPREAAHSKTAWREGGERHCSSCCQSHKCPFPFYAFKRVSAPSRISCQGMTCRQLASKNFCVGAGPIISWYVSCKTSGIMFYKTT